MPMSLELILFGSPEVRVNGKLISGFRSTKAQALFYYLAITGRAHTRATLAGLLWGDQPEDAARASLSKCLSNLRDLLGDALLIERQTVAFNRNYPYHLDTEHFIADVAQPPTAATIPSWQAALAFYRGDFLEGFYVRDAPDFEQWLLVQRAHYREAVINGLHALAGFYEQGGDLPSAITHTRRLLALEPWREEAHRQLMTLLARSGQRAAALAQFEACRRILDEELVVEPDAETVALVEEIRAGEFDKLYPGRVTRQQGDKVHLDHLVTPSLPHLVTNNLPISTTPLIGRECELSELSEMLGNPHCRLITIMGGGGTGKTRLALAAATAQVKNFRHGAAFVSLAAISEPTFMAHALLQALEQPLQGSQNAQAQLLSYLRDKEILLVLDNYEQLLPDVALLIKLVEHSAGVKLLVTSRERLALQAEQLFQVEGLNYPNLSATGTVEEFAACQLFLQRARQIKRDFVLNSETRTAIARICAACEGLPLALELAAGSLRTQSVLWIAEAVTASQPLPNIPLRDLPARHTSIQAVFEHSWRLLTAHEQAVLTQLSVFRSGFTLAAAEKVADAALETIAALLDKSLVRQQSAERFDLHELLRQFAGEKLKECCEKTPTQQRHLDYFLALAEEAASHLRSADQAHWLEQLAMEQDNLRTALAWALNAKQKENGARLGIALRRFWYIRGFYAEGWQWLEQLLRLVDDAAWRADLLYSQGTLARRSKESAIAADCFAQSLVLYRQQEDQRGIASALRSLGFMHYYQGNDVAARPLFEEALLLFRRLGDQEGIAVVLDNLGYIAKTPEETRRLHQESLALRRCSGNLHGITVSLAGLAQEAIWRTDYAAVHAYTKEHLQINEKLGNQDGMANSFYILAVIAYAEHNYSVAQELFEKSVKLYQATGDRAAQAGSLLGLGTVALKRSECELARRLFTQVLSSKQEHSPYQLVELLGYFAVADVMQVDARRCLTLLSAVTALNISLSNEFPPYEQADFAAAETTARQQLGDEAAAQAWAAGQQMTLTAALDCALQPRIV